VGTFKIKNKQYKHLKGPTRLVQSINFYFFVSVKEMSSSNWIDDAFTEEELLAIDAIEASYNFSLSSSSSSSAAPTVQATTSVHGHEEDPNQIPNNIRRQLPRSITSSTSYKRFPLSRCRGMKLLQIPEIFLFYFPISTSFCFENVNSLVVSPFDSNSKFFTMY